MKLLSLKELDMFDYVKTREKVEEYLSELNMIKFKYRNVLPPSLALNLFDIKVQSSGIPKKKKSSVIFICTFEIFLFNPFFHSTGIILAINAFFFSFI